MSDQIDQTSEDQEQEQAEVTTAAPEATAEPTSEPVAETPATSLTAAPAPSTAPPIASFDNDDDDDDFDGDDEGDEDDDSDDDGDDENVVEGPAEYVQREKSGRGRRIGGDVRPEDVDYKNIPLLSRFLDRRGRILSRRKTRVSAKVQRRIVVAIKRARHLALLPYTADQTRIVRSKRR